MNSMTSFFSEKELSLMAAMVKNHNGNIYASVNWDQAALDAGYKDSKNAKAMWYRLAKKLSDAHASVARARTTAAEEDDNAGEGSSKAPVKAPVTAGKKRKAAGAAQDGSTSGKADRATKKPKATGAHLKTGNKVGATKVNAEGHSSSTQTTSF